jgi:hypothetical protein
LPALPAEFAAFSAIWLSKESAFFSSASVWSRSFAISAMPSCEPVARDFVMFERLTAANQHGVAGGCAAKIFEVFVHLRQNAEGRFAGLGARGFAEELEDLP